MWICKCGCVCLGVFVSVRRTKSITNQTNHSGDNKKWQPLQSRTTADNHRYTFICEPYPFLSICVFYSGHVCVCVCWLLLTQLTQLSCVRNLMLLQISHLERIPQNQQYVLFPLIDCPAYFSIQRHLEKLMDKQKKKTHFWFILSIGAKITFRYLLIMPDLVIEWVVHLWMSWETEIR